MPDVTVELTAEDVEEYTQGRLAADDDGTTRALNAALSEVRRYCGWRVTPVAVETLTLDGPGGRLLSLPTLKLIELQSVTEQGVSLDVSTLDISAVGLVRKKCGGHWSHRYGAIQVTMNHGFNDAFDWQSAVLELIDRTALAVGENPGNAGPMVEKRIGDVTYRWLNSIGDPANQGLFGTLNRTILDLYRIEPTP